MKESLFRSAIRSFCITFATVFGALLCLILFLMGCALFSPAIPQTTELTYLPDASGKRELLSSSSSVILQINIDGVIGVDGLTGDKIKNLLVDSQEGLLSNHRVKGILLYINSPGGAANDSDIIYRALVRYKEQFNIPIYAYVDGLCASGAMYIASAADKIYSSNVSIIGSVGVIMGPMFNYVNGLDKIGVQALTLTSGKDKDELNPFRPWKPDEGASIQKLNSALYENFVSIVAQARPKLTKEKLINEYGANVFFAQQAEQYGYVDIADAAYEQALTDLVQKAGIADTKAYQVVLLKSNHPFLSQLMAKSPILSGEIKHKLDLGSVHREELSGKPLYLYQPNG